LESKLKIVQIVARIPAPPVDGGSRYVYNTGKMLAELGHELTIIAFKSKKHSQNPEMIKSFGDIIYEDDDFKPFNIFSVFKSLFLRIPVSVVHRINIPKMERLLDIFIEKNPVLPDKYIFLLEGIHAGILIDTLRLKFPESKILLRQANIEHELLNRRADDTWNPLFKLFFKLQSKLMYDFEINCFKKSDSVTAISEYDKDKFIKMLPGLNCHVVFPSAELSKPVFNKKDLKKILAISDWSWHPNIIGLNWFLNEIFPVIKNKISDIEFNIIGGGIEEALKTKYESSNIHFLGFVESLDYFYESSNLLVVPLLYGGGVKIKLIDALSKGMTIIATKFGIEGIPVTHNKEVLIANDSKSFIDQIINLINNPEKSKFISENAYKWAEINLNSNEIALKFESFLKEINNR
jgi:glycosyltransferase involved in cell wall biosynthesis